MPTSNILFVCERFIRNKVFSFHKRQKILQNYIKLSKITTFRHKNTQGSYILKHKHCTRRCFETFRTYIHAGAYAWYIYGIMQVVVIKNHNPIEHLAQFWVKNLHLSKTFTIFVGFLCVVGDTPYRESETPTGINCDKYKTIQ